MNLTPKEPVSRQTGIVQNIREINQVVVHDWSLPILDPETRDFLSNKFFDVKDPPDEECEMYLRKIQSVKLLRGPNRDWTIQEQEMVATLRAVMLPMVYEVCREHRILRMQITFALDQLIHMFRSIVEAYPMRLSDSISSLEEARIDEVDDCTGPVSVGYKQVMSLSSLEPQEIERFCVGLFKQPNLPSAEFARYVVKFRSMELLHKGRKGWTPLEKTMGEAIQTAARSMKSAFVVNDHAVKRLYMPVLDDLFAAFRTTIEYYHSQQKSDSVSS